MLMTSAPADFGVIHGPERTLEQFPKSLSVIAGLVPAISITEAHAILIEMAGTSPAMTTTGVNLIGKRSKAE